ncbi:MAG: hypothetical protein COA57_15590 [Flavobacteriales bacterium]|nr:MAG: hypothetical protein COA57_15590 [Flavobacteriales bacterium]
MKTTVKESSFIKLLNKAVEEDNPEITPDLAIRQRLLNRMELKPRKEVKKNSFSNLLLVFFTPNFMGYKAGIAVATVGFSLWLNHQQNISTYTLPRDTTTVYIDTSFNRWQDTSAAHLNFLAP